MYEKTTQELADNLRNAGYEPDKTYTMFGREFYALAGEIEQAAKNDRAKEKSATEILKKVKSIVIQLLDDWDDDADRNWNLGRLVACLDIKAWRFGNPKKKETNNEVDGNRDYQTGIGRASKET